MNAFWLGFSVYARYLSQCAFQFTFSHIYVCVCFFSSSLSCISNHVICHFFSTLFHTFIHKYVSWLSLAMIFYTRNYMFNNFAATSVAMAYFSVPICNTASQAKPSQASQPTFTLHKIIVIIFFTSLLTALSTKEFVMRLKNCLHFVSHRRYNYCTHMTAISGHFSFFLYFSIIYYCIVIAVFRPFEIIENLQSRIIFQNDNNFICLTAFSLLNGQWAIASVETQSFRKTHLSFAI